MYCGTLVDLISSLEEAQATAQLTRRLAVLTDPSLLVVDEIGYLPTSQVGAVLYALTSKAPLRPRDCLASRRLEAGTEAKKVWSCSRAL